MNPQTELEGHSMILVEHLRAMTRGLRKLPADKWDFTFDQAAPTSRTLAVHALQWLQCDRQHINNPDPKSHLPVPEPPTDPQEICAAMDAEANEWEALLKNLKPEDLDRPGKQFGQEGADMNVRGFIVHMVQNVIYKHGQFATIFFALGLDGDGPYEAPFPNAIYRELFGSDWGH